ncbi:MAG: hypothetical protein L6Q69_20065 [Zoogloea sp.]|nr:hypothetical protein [Zoogloea sp.]
MSIARYSMRRMAATATTAHAPTAQANRPSVSHAGHGLKKLTALHTANHTATWGPLIGLEFIARIA